MNINLEYTDVRIWNKNFAGIIGINEHGACADFTLEYHSLVSLSKKYPFTTSRFGVSGSIVVYADGDIKVLCSNYNDRDEAWQDTVLLNLQDLSQSQQEELKQDVNNMLEANSFVIKDIFVVDIDSLCEALKAM